MIKGCILAHYHRAPWWEHMCHSSLWFGPKRIFNASKGYLGTKACDIVFATKNAKARHMHSSSYNYILHLSQRSFFFHNTSMKGTYFLHCGCTKEIDAKFSKPFTENPFWMSYSVPKLHKFINWLKRVGLHHISKL